MQSNTYHFQGRSIRRWACYWKEEGQDEKEGDIFQHGLVEFALGLGLCCLSNEAMGSSNLTQQQQRDDETHENERCDEEREQTLTKNTAETREREEKFIEEHLGKNVGR